MTGIAAGLLLPLSACNEIVGGQEADIDLVESEIETGVQEQSGESVTADCPTSIDWEVGGTFHCVVEFVDGSRSMANVTMENDAGDITWQLQ